MDDFITFFLTVKEECYKIIPSFFTIKEGSTSHLGLLPSGKKRKTALRCSEPLRSMVGGPSKVFAMLCGLGFCRFCTIAIYLEHTKGLDFNF